MIRDLARILGPAHRGALRTYLAWLVGYAVLQGVSMALLVPVLDALLRGDTGQALRWLAVMAVVVTATCVARYVQAMKGFGLSLVTLGTLHDRLGDHVARLPLGWFTTETTGRLSRSATGGVQSVTTVTAHLLAPVVSGVLTPATIAVALFVFDWRLGVTAVLCAPLILLTHRWSAAAVGRGEERADAAATVAASRVVEYARNQQTLRAFGRASGGYRPLEDAIAAQRTAGGRWLAETFPKILSGGLVVQLSFAALITVGTLLAVDGSIEPVRLVALLALTARFTGPLSEAAARAGALRMAGNDLRRLVEILDEPPLAEPEESRPLTAPGEIEFDRVGFGYRPGEPVLRDVSFRVPARTMTAVVGPSGAGKTTLTRLIARFFDVDSGSVRVGGVDVRQLTGEDLMSQLSLVFQDVYLFNDTLEANIRVGRPDASDAEVREAARLAGVDELVARLPRGWETRVGEGGMSLSGGERQRVSVARAILKRAPIVLLDEATAALDPENERYVQRALRTLMEHSTLLVIAHKLPTVVAADRILVLDGGGVAEVGTHEELLAAGGRYTAFWNERRRGDGWRLVPTAPEGGVGR
ncbi:ATP-binding cassette domain-containing protein [Streptomyces alkaliphilus]|uniref:ATP-binding cassette domain-containing protein n=1 Tax=Streptomyces alkaliphilus TaxID=1472722 RepID=A0A7W3XZI2_9ACTN|nr:ABC transporter ATP-binding protein [Streptomyces alkaliphilus]MBB0242574.1 ATP-binding cassette domain-containing protein [Streptomyces alkaliphilus]